MKYSIYTLILLFCCSFGSLGAQTDSDIEFSDFRKQRRSILRTVLPLDSGKSVLVKSKGSSSILVSLFSNPKVTFELLDENMNTKKSVKSDIVLSRSWDSDKKTYRFSQLINGKIYVFYTSQKNKSSFTLYASELDEKTMVLSRKPKRIGVFNKKDNKDFGSVGLDISRNKERIVFAFKERVKDTKVTQHIELIVLDKDLEKIWQTSMLKPVRDKKVSKYLDFTVNNKGEVFVLEQTREGNLISLKGNTVEYDFLINKFDASGEKTIERELKFADEAIKQLNISFNFNEELLALGFYTDRRTGSRSVGGSVYLRYDTKLMRPISKKMQPFELDFLVQGSSDFAARRASKRAEKGKSINMNFNLRDIVYRSDGGAVLIGEEYYITTNTDDRGNVTSYNHYFNEIILINLDADGDVVWSEKIFKRQSFTSSRSYLNPLYGQYRFASFTHAITDGQICFFFNDDPRNLELKDKQRDVKRTPSNLKSNFCKVSVDQDGNMDKSVLFQSRDMGVIIYPAFSRPFDDARQELVLLGRYRKKERLARYRPN